MRWGLALRAMFKNVSRIAVSASSTLIKNNTDARAFATTFIQPQGGFLGGRHVNNYTKTNAITRFSYFFSVGFTGR